MIVLTGVNYANKKTLYEDTKQSLKKFMGDINKTESDFFDKHEKEERIIKGCICETRIWR